MGHPSATGHRSSLRNWPCAKLQPLAREHTRTHEHTNTRTHEHEHAHRRTHREPRTAARTAVCTCEPRSHAPFCARTLNAICVQARTRAHAHARSFVHGCVHKHTSLRARTLSLAPFRASSRLENFRALALVRGSRFPRASTRALLPIFACSCVLLGWLEAAEQRLLMEQVRGMRLHGRHPVVGWYLLERSVGIFERMLGTRLESARSQTWREKRRRLRSAQTAGRERLCLRSLWLAYFDFKFLCPTFKYALCNCFRARFVSPAAIEWRCILARCTRFFAESGVPDAARECSHLRRVLTTWLLRCVQGGYLLGGLGKACPHEAMQVMSTPAARWTKTIMSRSDEISHLHVFGSDVCHAVRNPPHWAERFLYATNLPACTPVVSTSR
eukprot:6207640-Pleurochrysis_carterae.AAC.2